LASFEEHIQKATSNLKFLEQSNLKLQDYWDWQVTTTFYVAVHVVNAHLARVSDLHYRTHEHVKNAINPLRRTAEAAVNEEIYLCYVKLESLSRRSRYLCHESKGEASAAHQTYDVHFTKAIKCLDKILDFFCTQHSITSIPVVTVKSPDLSTRNGLKYFSV